MSKDIVTKDALVTMEIEQDDLCKAVEFWLREKLGINQPLLVLEVRTRVSEDKSAIVSFNWEDIETSDG